MRGKDLKGFRTILKPVINDLQVKVQIWQNKKFMLY